MVGSDPGSPVATGGLVGLAPQTKYRAPQIEAWKHYESVELLSVFRLSSPLVET